MCIDSYYPVVYNNRDKIRHAEGPSIISDISKNPVGKDLAFRFVQENWNDIYDR